jgi:hypothetical protein
MPCMLLFIINIVIVHVLRLVYHLHYTITEFDAYLEIFGWSNAKFIDAFTVCLAALVRPNVT